MKGFMKFILGCIVLLFMIIVWIVIGATIGLGWITGAWGLIGFLILLFVCPVVLIVLIFKMIFK